MTRVIGGSAGGRRLRTPPGDGTRPTADRVREALFSSLEARLGTLEGLAFLDLYAGSGAVGLEARSRGASRVLLVESDRRTADLARDNARTVGLGGVTVVTGPVRRVLAGTPPHPFDVTFLDPPYAVTTEEAEADLAALVTGDWLAEGAVVVLERARRSPAPAWPEGFGEPRVRRYGETVLLSADTTRAR